MSILLLLAATVTAPTPTPVIAAVALTPVSLSSDTPDLSAPRSPHVPMRVAPRLAPSQAEVMAATRPVSRSTRPRWRVAY